MPSPECLVSVNGAAFVTTRDGLDVAGGASLVVKLNSVAGVDVFQLYCTNTDELLDTVTVNGGITIDPLLKTATFTAPSNGHALLFSVVVNNQLDVNGRNNPTLKTSFAIFTGAVGDPRLFAQNETNEGNASYGWLPKVNALVRASSGASRGSNVTTTSATPTLLASYTPIINSSVVYAAVVTARDIYNGIVKTWTKKIVGIRAGTASTLVVGTQEDIQDPSVVGGVDPGWVCNLDASGNTIRVRGTGTVGATVYWNTTTESLASTSSVDAPAGSPPTVTAILPDIGANAAGQAVTIYGTGFISGATSVTIGGVVATGISVINSTSLTAVTPATTAGLLAIGATTAFGTGTLASAFTSLETNLLPYTLHYAGVGASEAGGYVTAVADQGPLAHALTAGGSVSPTRNAVDAGYNNKSTFGFSASDSRLQNSTYSITQPVTRFVVGNTSGAAGPQYLADGGTGYLGLSASGTTGGEVYANASLAFTGDMSQKQVVCVAYNGASSFVSISAQTETTGNVGTSTPGGLTLGTYFGNAYGCMGKIAICFQVHGSMTLAQRNSVKLALGAYYGKAIAA